MGCWCVTGEGRSRRCVLLKRSAESFLTAPSFRSIALMCASKHNRPPHPHPHPTSPNLPPLPPHFSSQPGDNKLRELESGINQTQMTWLASCDKYIQEEEGKKRGETEGLTFKVGGEERNQDPSFFWHQVLSCSLQSVHGDCAAQPEKT